jgi:TrmH family RNA methyltransferase
LPTSPPKRISGRDNPEFRRFLAVRVRRNRDLVLVEGPKMLEEALRSNIPLRAVAGDESVLTAAPSVNAPFFWFSPALMKGLSDVETHQGVVALAERPRFSRGWLASPQAFVLILNGLQDPGNVGTLFRTAEAAGVTGVLLTRGCADPLSPKALRASAGSAFRVPHVPDLSVDQLLALLPTRIELAAAVAGPSSLAVFETTFARPVAVAFGAEGSGLDKRLEARASMRVRVPFATDVESLNVAAAGAVILFEMARQAGSLRL